MNVPKIKAALYSIYMNKRGYTVLQNTVQPSTTVRAVKHYRIIDPYTLDIVEDYHQITRNFDGIKPKKVERYLSTNKFAFYNEETNSVDYQTVSLYKKFETGKIMKKKKKGEINWDVLDKRDFSYIDKKVGRKKQSLPDFRYAAVGVLRTHEITVPKTFGDVEIDKFEKQGKPFKFKSKKLREAFKPKNFWEVLTYNLRRKEEQLTQLKEDIFHPKSAKKKP